MLLDEIVIGPTGSTGQSFTDVEARYEEITDVEYDTGVSFPDGRLIPVQDVQ